MSDVATTPNPLRRLTDRFRRAEPDRNRFTEAALERYKREGLDLAVRARWITMAVIGVLLVFLHPHADVFYYHVILALLALNGVNTVRFDGYGIISFKFNTRALRMYADFVIRRVDPKTYSTPSPQTGLFGVGDLNGDGTEDFRMVYSTGDEQYFYLLP